MGKQINRRNASRQALFASLVLAPMLLMNSAVVTARPASAFEQPAVRADRNEMSWWAQFTQWLLVNRASDENGYDNAQTQDKDDRSSEDLCTGSCG